MFEIHVVFDRNHDPRAEVGRGSIRIGEFEEVFEMVFEYWSLPRYMAQWREGVKRIIDGHSMSCLLTSVTNPVTANFIFWWPIYRVQETVVFQNQMLFLDLLNEPFDVNNPYQFVDPRETVSEDGLPISEWQTTVNELVAWLRAAH
jgi:CdiI N-terminal domain